MSAVRYQICTTDDRSLPARGTPVGPYLAVRQVRVPGWGTLWAIDHTTTGLSCGCYGSREIAFDIADRLAPVSEQLRPGANFEKVVGRALLARIAHCRVRDERGRPLAPDAEGEAG